MVKSGGAPSFEREREREKRTEEKKKVIITGFTAGESTIKNTH